MDFLKSSKLFVPRDQYAVVAVGMMILGAAALILFLLQKYLNFIKRLKGEGI